MIGRGSPADIDFAALCASTRTSRSRRNYPGACEIGQIFRLPGAGLLRLLPPVDPVIAQFVGCVQQQGLSCQYCAEQMNGYRLI